VLAYRGCLWMQEWGWWCSVHRHRCPPRRCPGWNCKKLGTCLPWAFAGEYLHDHCELLCRGQGGPPVVSPLSYNFSIYGSFIETNKGRFVSLCTSSSLFLFRPLRRCLATGKIFQHGAAEKYAHVYPTAGRDGWVFKQSEVQQ
jgi:hypothetical protein